MNEELLVKLLPESASALAVIIVVILFLRFGSQQLKEHRESYSDLVTRLEQSQTQLGERQQELALAIREQTNEIRRRNGH